MNFKNIISFKLKEAKCYKDLRRAKMFFHETQLRVIHFIPPVVLSLLAALFEGAGFALLVPVAQGVITGDFNFLQKYSFLQNAVLSIRRWTWTRGLHMDVIFLSAMVFFAMFAKSVFNYLARLTANFRMVRFSNDLRKVLFSRFLEFGVSYFHKKSIGHLQQVLVSFVQMVGIGFTEIQECIYIGVTLLIYLEIMFWLSRSLTLFTVIIFPLLFFVSHSLIQKLKRSSAAYSKQLMELSKKIANSLSCVPLVKACSFEPQEFEWFSFASDRVADCQYQVEKKRLLVQPLQEIILLIVILVLVAGMSFIAAVSPAKDRVAGFLVFFVVLRRAAASFGVFNRIQAALAGMRGPPSRCCRAGKPSPSTETSPPGTACPRNIAIPSATPATATTTATAACTTKTTQAATTSSR